MNILIVESDPDLGALWQRHLKRVSDSVVLTADADTAVDLIQNQDFDVILIDLILEKGQALTVSDVASFRQPDANVIFVTSSTFFADGSIFSLSRNARMMVQSETPPEDLAAIVAHYGRRVTHAGVVH